MIISGIFHTYLNYSPPISPATQISHIHISLSGSTFQRQVGGGGKMGRWREGWYFSISLICKSGDLDIKLFRIYSLSRLEIYHNLSFLPDIWWECWSWRGTRVKVYCCFSMSWESNNYLLHSNCQLVYQSDTYLAPVCEPPSHWHLSTSCEQQGLLGDEVKSNSLNYNTQWTHERCTSVLNWAP